MNKPNRYEDGTCEWEPGLKSIGALHEEPLAPCPNKATIAIGSDGDFHLCDECAALPVFKHFRKRVRLLGAPKPGEQLNRPEVK